MADFPIIDNIKEKLISGQKGHRDEASNNEETAFGQGEMDVLEQYRISPHTELRDDVLTPSKLGKVRFNYSQPKGFSVKQVEEYHSHVAKSIQWYISELERRDRDVHKLATEIDKYKTDVQNTRFQLEVLQGVGGQAVVDESGDYVKESQMGDAELQVIELESKIAELEEELRFERITKNELRQELEALRSAPAPSVAAPALPNPAGESLSSAERTELENLRIQQKEMEEWASAVEIEYARMETELATAKSALANAGTQATTPSAPAVDVDAYEEAIANLTSEAEAKDGQIANMEERLHNAKEVVSGLTSERDNALAAIDAVQTERDQALASINSVETERNQAVASLESVRAELGTVVRERDSALSELESVRNATPETVVDPAVQAELNIKTQQVDELTVKVDELESHIGQLDEYINEVEKIVEDKDQEILTLRQEVREATPEKIQGYNLPAGVTPEDLGL